MKALILILLYISLLSAGQLTSFVGQPVVGLTNSKNTTLSSGTVYLIKSVSQTSLDNNLPLTYTIDQNYPNPFNPTTSISYQLPKDGNVTVKIYNILGHEVATLVNGSVKAGYHSINFDGSSFASGQYLYKIEAGDFSSVKKMLLLK